MKKINDLKHSQRISEIMSWHESRSKRITVVLFPEVKDSIIHRVSSKNNNGMKLPVYGYVIDSSTYHLRSTKSVPITEEIVKLYYLGKIELDEGKLFFNLLNDLKFDMTLEDLSKGLSEGKLFKRFKDDNNNYSHEIVIIMMDMSHLYLRINNSDYPLGIVNKKNVAIIGLGSGGSLIALYLAKSGLRKLTLIDGDMFLDHNIVRHTCSLYDVGRYKTLAVKDHILRRIPNIEITTVEKHFSLHYKEEEKFFDNLLSEVDLIVSATGDHALSTIINYFAYKRGVPVIYAGAFEKIIGGIMIRVDPRKESACYDCIYSLYGEENANVKKPKLTDKPSLFYGRDENDMLTQPGLGLDIDLITLPTVKFILSTLLGEKDIWGFQSDIYYWYNRNLDNSNNKTFSLQGDSRTLNKRLDCVICSKAESLGGD